MNYAIDSFDGFDPVRDTNLLSPLDTREFSSSWLSQLYSEEQLTEDEYLLLDYFGSTSVFKDGIVFLSFQGLKRLISMHQAKLTKAINRLVSKGLLEKNAAGYSLTKEGLMVFQRLTAQFSKQNNPLPKQLYSHVSRGIVQGPTLGMEEYEAIASALIGKWFGNFRYTSKIVYESSYELAWVSTDGQISGSLIVGPKNDLRLSLSSSMYIESQNQLQILTNHISQAIESEIDAPVVFTSHSIYENREQLSTEIDDAVIPYAG